MRIKCSKQTNLNLHRDRAKLQYELVCPSRSRLFLYVCVLVVEFVKNLLSFFVHCFATMDSFYCLKVIQLLRLCTVKKMAIQTFEGVPEPLFKEVLLPVSRGS